MMTGGRTGDQATPGEGAGLCEKGKPRGGCLTAQQRTTTSPVPLVDEGGVAPLADHGVVEDWAVTELHNARTHRQRDPRRNAALSLPLCSVVCDKNRERR